MVRELLTQDEYFAAVTRGEGVIVVVDKVKGQTAHPSPARRSTLPHFREMVIVNARKNGRYYWAASFPEARRELDADPCNCIY